jgi:SAM-dependent methyltransferase
VTTTSAALKRRAISNVVRQFGHPRGIAGQAVGWVMAHRRSNRDRITEGHVYGVDHSEVMVQQAGRRNAAAIRAHRVHLTRAPVDRLPTFDDPLDAILAVNSVGFWPNPVERLRELRHLLRPAGHIALVSQPRCPGATRATTARAVHELQDLLAQAGFAQIRAETLGLDPPVACVLADNPTEGPS